MGGVDLPTFLPSVGVLGLLAWLLIHVMRQASGDRGGYQRAIKDLREDHAAEIKEMSARHDAQITDLRTQIAGLRGEVAELRTELEAERRARWEAEDTAAHYRRLAGETDDPRTT